MAHWQAKELVKPTRTRVVIVLDAEVPLSRHCRVVRGLEILRYGCLIQRQAVERVRRKIVHDARALTQSARLREEKQTAEKKQSGALIFPLV